MLEYFIKNYNRLFIYLVEHVNMLVIALFFGILSSLVLCFLIYNIPILNQPIMVILRIIYTIPSLAFFAILIPISGIGVTTAIIVLSVYTLFFLVNSFLDGLNGIDPDVVEAGRAVGYSNWQLFLKIQLPLSMPAIFSGIRLAAISTIGIGCIAYTIGAGGIGSILFEGMRQISYIKIFWGGILVIGLNVFVNTLLLKVENYYIKRMNLNI